MRVDDEGLRRAFQEGTRRRDTGDCPATDALRRLAGGDVEAGERTRLADHLASCSSCSSEYALARELVPGGGPVAGDRLPPLARYAWAIPAAAVLMVSVGLGLVYLSSSAPRQGPGEPIWRGGEAPAVDTVMPADGARLAEPPRGLTWPSAPGTVHRVVLYDGESMELWRGGPTELDSVELPEEIRRRLATPGLYYWRVYRERDRGQSSLYSFEIVP
jgi:hypothetical protein